MYCSHLQLIFSFDLKYPLSLCTYTYNMCSKKEVSLTVF